MTTPAAQADRQRAIRVLAIAAAACLAMLAIRAALGVTHGLHAEYFENPSHTGDSRQRVDTEMSTASLRDAWLGDPPGAFSARWYGFLMITDAGRYVFATTSDDASSITIDGHLVVDNGGSHSVLLRTGSADLTSGPHAVLIEYAQFGGDFALTTQWGRDQGHLGPIPAWQLSPRRVGTVRLVTAHAVDWIALTLGAACIAWCAWIVVTFHRKSATQMLSARPRAASLAFFVLLTVVETWPLAAHPAHLSRNDNDDTMLNEWTLAWVAHQAPRSPLHVFDANIFYPDRNTLAYSEAMIVQSAMAAPFLWLGASPVLAYNLVLLAGFALSGWTMSIVIARWTDSWAAGIVSGILFAFNAHTLARLPHMQAQHVEFLPLTLMAFDALLRSPRVGHAVSLAVWYVLESLTSMHLFVFAAIAMIVGVLVRPADWLGSRFAPVASMLALAAGIAAALLFPFFLPYWWVHRHFGIVRSLEDIRVFAASWRDYLSTPARIHFVWWSRYFFAQTALFPGALATLLAVFGLVRGAWRDPRARMCVAFGIVGVVLSFGPDVPGYAALYHAFPPMWLIRGAARFGYLGIVAVAAVAGWGVLQLERAVPRRVWMGLVPALVLVAAVEPLCAPIGYRRFERVPRIYSLLRGESHAIVAEFPFPDGGAGVPWNTRYMLNSTEHWQPMLNGFSGYIPPSYHENSVALRRFPDATSIARLRTVGVTHVFVHLDEMRPHVLDAIEAIPGFQKIAAEGSTVLFRITWE